MSQIIQWARLRMKIGRDMRRSTTERKRRKYKDLTAQPTQSGPRQSLNDVELAKFTRLIQARKRRLIVILRKIAVCPRPSLDFNAGRYIHYPRDPDDREAVHHFRSPEYFYVSVVSTLCSVAITSVMNLIFIVHSSIDFPNEITDISQILMNLAEL